MCPHLFSLHFSHYFCVVVKAAAAKKVNRADVLLAPVRMARKFIHSIPSPFGSTDVSVTYYVSYGEDALRASSDQWGLFRRNVLLLFGRSFQHVYIVLIAADTRERDAQAGERGAEVPGQEHFAG
jgi:hypothetical protein